MVTTVIGDWNEFIANLIVGGANSLQIGEVLIQWGLSTITTGGEREITYPIAYTTTPITQCTMKATSIGSTVAFTNAINARSITAFTVQGRTLTDTGAGATDITDALTVEFYWISIGINTA